MSQTLSEGCSIGDDCSTITCDMNFVETPITFKLKVNKCDDPVSVTALLDVPDLQNVKWSHTYNSDDIVKVPGFITFFPSILFADVYVQVALKSNEDRLYLEVNLLAGKPFLDKHQDYPVNVTVIEGDLPISNDHCGIFEWW